MRLSSSILVPSCSSCLSNIQLILFISNPYDPGSDLPGALGKGQATASALGNFFKFWAYASTIIGAIVAGMLSNLQVDL